MLFCRSSSLLKAGGRDPWGRGARRDPTCSSNPLGRNKLKVTWSYQLEVLPMAHLPRSLVSAHLCVHLVSRPCLYPLPTTGPGGQPLTWFL